MPGKELAVEATKAMKKITPFLWFDKRAEEAVQHYTSIFKKSKIHSTKYYPQASPGTPAEVMTIHFALEGQHFIALNGGPEFRFTPAISFSILCKSQKKVDHLWARLTEGGQEGQCGWLTDKFGVSWQIVPEALPKLVGGKNKQKAAAATAAMMKMKKIDIKALKAAYDEG